MAITIDATSSGAQHGFSAGPTTVNWTATISGSASFIFVGVAIWQDAGGTGNVSSCSVGGVACTRATYSAGTTSDNLVSEIWYLASPPTGSKTVSVTVTGATDSIKCSATSLIGTATSSALGTTSVKLSSGGNPSQSIITGTNNSLVYGVLSRFGTTAISARTFTNLYFLAANSTEASTDYDLTTTAGSYTNTYTGSNSNAWCICIAEVKPYGAAANVSKAFGGGMMLI